MSSLKRWEELTVPNWPAESILIGMASLLVVATPRIPAAKNDVCVFGVPIRVVPLSLPAPRYLCGCYLTRRLMSGPPGGEFTSFPAKHAWGLPEGQGSD
jgi:hypothetical protein